MVKSRKTIRKKVRHRGGNFGPFQTRPYAEHIYGRSHASKMNFPRMKRLVNYLSDWDETKRYLGIGQGSRAMYRQPENDAEQQLEDFDNGVGYGHGTSPYKGKKGKKKKTKKKHKHKKSKDGKSKSR